MVVRKESSSIKGSVAEKLLSSTAANLARNIYEEFIDEPHECYPNRASVLNFAWFPTLREFLDSARQSSSERPWYSGVIASTAGSQDKEEWLYQILTQDCLNVRSVSIT